jgi:DUF971 family protein
METGRSATKIILHKISRTLEVEFDNKECFVLPCDYLRAFSPSAEMRQQEKSVEAYKQVNILSIEMVGQYAIRPLFSDGHRTGIYSWQTLYELGQKWTKKR